MYGVNWNPKVSRAVEPCVSCGVVTLRRLPGKFSLRTRWSIPKYKCERECKHLHGCDQHDAGGPTAKIPRERWNKSAKAATHVIKRNVKPDGKRAGVFCCCA